MTIPFPVMMVFLAPEMTAAPVASVLVHRSRAFHVKNVTMTHVVWNQDIVRSWCGAQKPASAIEIWGHTIHARSLPNIRIA